MLMNVHGLIMHETAANPAGIQRSPVLFTLGQMIQQINTGDYPMDRWFSLGP